MKRFLIVSSSIDKNLLNESILKKISYTILLLSIIRIGNFIPLVGINQAYLFH